jgi:hypothetical protein
MAAIVARSMIEGDRYSGEKDHPQAVFRGIRGGGVANGTRGHFLVFHGPRRRPVADLLLNAPLLAAHMEASDLPRCGSNFAALRYTAPNT